MDVDDVQRADLTDRVYAAQRELAVAEDTLRAARDHYDQTLLAMPGSRGAQDGLDAARWHRFLSAVAVAGMQLRLDVALDERALRTGAPRMPHGWPR